MRQNFIAIAIMMTALVIAAGIAWAMAPVPICFYTASGVCTNVTRTNALPTVVSP